MITRQRGVVALWLSFAALLLVIGAGAAWFLLMIAIGSIVTT